MPIWQVIDSTGVSEKVACRECHLVNVKFKRGEVCVECRRAAWVAEVRYRREMNRMYGDEFYKITRVKRRRKA